MKTNSSNWIRIFIWATLGIAIHSASADLTDSERDREHKLWQKEHELSTREHAIWRQEHQKTKKALQTLEKLLKKHTLAIQKHETEIKNHDESIEKTSEDPDQALKPSQVSRLQKLHLKNRQEHEKLETIHRSTQKIHTGILDLIEKIENIEKLSQKNDSE